MKKMFAVLVVLIVTVIGLACSDNSDPATASVGVSVSAKSSPANTAQPADSSLELKAIKEDYAKLQRSQRGFLQMAQGTRGPCWAYDNYRLENDLLARYASGEKEGKFLDKDLANSLSGDVENFARDAVNRAYNGMKEGQSVRCDRATYEMDNIEQIAKMIDEYHMNDKSIYDPEVLRQAYLKAARAEIKEAAAVLAERPDSADVRGGVYGLIDDAHSKWNFSLADLGVSADLAKKVGIDPNS